MRLLVYFAVMGGIFPSTQFASGEILGRGVGWRLIFKRG
jgi:hypothetical protein